MKTLPLLLSGLLIIMAFEKPVELNLNGTDKKCTECHGDLIENSVVHPIAEEGCELCHEATGKRHPGQPL